MNLVLLEQAEMSMGCNVVLSGRRYEHVKTVHRAKVGDSLRVGVVDGCMGEAVVTRIDDREVQLSVGELTEVAPAPLPLVVCVALPRPPTLNKVLQQLTAMGIKRFHFFHSRRVEKSFWQSHALGDDEVGRQLRLGLEQGRDTRMPQVQWHRGFRAFVEEAVPSLLETVTAGYFAHVGAGRPCPSTAEETLVVVGPEGGFVPYEVTRLEEAGLGGVGLGPRPLRVETACVSLAARVGLP